MIVCCVCLCLFVCFCKQKTAYDMRISDWSSDVCSSDLFGEMAAQLCEQAVVFAAVRQSHRAVLSQIPEQPGMVVLIDVAVLPDPAVGQRRSEERRSGQESVSTCRYGGGPYQ